MNGHRVVLSLVTEGQFEDNWIPKWMLNNRQGHTNADTNSESLVFVFLLHEKDSTRKEQGLVWNR